MIFTLNNYRCSELSPGESILNPANFFFDFSFFCIHDIKFKHDKYKRSRDNRKRKTPTQKAPWKRGPAFVPLYLNKSYRGKGTAKK